MEPTLLDLTLGTKHISLLVIAPAEGRIRERADGPSRNKRLFWKCCYMHRPALTDEAYHEQWRCQILTPQRKHACSGSSLVSADGLTHGPSATYLLSPSQILLLVVVHSSGESHRAYVTVPLLVLRQL